MREAVGDLWDYLQPHAVLGITVNGNLTKDGRAVMGAGCAKDARDRFPGIDERLGRAIQQYDSRCFMFSMPSPNAWTLVTIPTKHDWRDPADPSLIVRSSRQLVEMADKHNWTEIVTVRFGVGMGGLSWRVVKPLIDDILDDRFLIVNRA